MRYTFEKAEKIKEVRPKFKLESNLIGKKMAEHLANGYKLIN